MTALEAIYYGSSPGDNGFISPPEVVRLLSIAKKEEIELRNQVLRHKRTPLADVLAVDAEICQHLAATLQAKAGKYLSEDVLGEVFDGLRGWADRDLNVARWAPDQKSERRLALQRSSWFSTVRAC